MLFQEALINRVADGGQDVSFPRALVRDALAAAWDNVVGAPCLVNAVLDAFGRNLRRLMRYLTVEY